MAKLTLNVSDDVFNEIKEFAAREKVDEDEAMRRILSIVKVSNEEKKKGHSLGVINDKDMSVIAKLVGV